MELRGHIENGKVILDESASLPEGAEVRIEVVNGAANNDTGDGIEEPLSQKLLRHAGKAVGLPPDAAQQHDHYLYGTPKR